MLITLYGARLDKMQRLKIINPIVFSSQSGAHNFVFYRIIPRIKQFADSF